jgi:hypothetical protein
VAGLLPPARTAEINIETTAASAIAKAAKILTFFILDLLYRAI